MELKLNAQNLFNGTAFLEFESEGVMLAQYPLRSF
jgi:hypothetical protein